jgi:hypothetical protein
MGERSKGDSRGERKEDGFGGSKGVIERDIGIARAWKALVT